jgi:probable F420-dependent oxidoreductase
MKFGVCLPNYGKTSTVGILRKTAIEAEKLGYASVWTTDHLLMPAGSGTPYERILESVTTLAYLATITKKIKIGISSLVLPMRNPVVVAKQLATVDLLSAGRLMLVVGVGWNENEYKHLGSNFHDRGGRLDESIRLIETLWRGERTFDSQLIPERFTEAMFEPRPVQKKLPLWIGGTSRAAMKRAINLGDAWHPDAQPLDAFKALVRKFRNMQGGSQKPITTRIGLNVRTRETVYKGAQGEDLLTLSRDVKKDEDIVEVLRKLGVSHLIVEINTDGSVPLKTQIENLRFFAKYFIGH